MLAIYIKGNGHGVLPQEYKQSAYHKKETKEIKLVRTESNGPAKPTTDFLPIYVLLYTLYNVLSRNHT